MRSECSSIPLALYLSLVNFVHIVVLFVLFVLVTVACGRWSPCYSTKLWQWVIQLRLFQWTARTSPTCVRLRDVFHYWRQKAYSTKSYVYTNIVQNTHFDPKMENCIWADWGYKSYFALYNSNLRCCHIIQHFKIFSEKSVQGYFSKLHICYWNNNG